MYVTQGASHPDSVVEGSSGCIRLLAEEQAGAVDQAQVLVQDNLLRGAGDAWPVADLDCPRPLQAVDQRALANIGQPHNACIAAGPAVGQR